MLCIIYINLPMYKTAILKKPLNSIMKFFQKGMVPIPASCPGPWGCKGSMQAESRCDRCELAGILLHGARLFLGARMNMYIYIY